jgi:hypothetical protein
MSQSKLDTSLVVRLLLQDSVPTLGERARAEVLRLAANHETLAREWLESGQPLDEAQRSFDRAVVDGLQQAAHDLFWDTTWPACPLHRRHPLWYDETREAWCCGQDPAVVAALGSLADLRPPAA